MPASSSYRRMTVFGVIAAATFSACSSAPTPLYHFYQETFGLSSLTVTIIFAAYAVSLLAALLTFGSISDHIGRKPAICASLAVNAIAMLLFMFAEGGGLLIAARVVQGVAMGMAIPTLGATILDTDSQRGPMLNSITPFIGLTAGSLMAGLLMTHAPDPAHLVFVVLLVVTLLEILLLMVMPETTQRRPGALTSLRPHIAIPASARSAVMRTSPVNIAGWALGGFYLSLMPSLVMATTGIRSPLVGASVVSVLMLVATATVLLTRNMPAIRVLPVGTLSLLIGVAVTLIGVNLQQVALLFAGTMIVGIGFGGNFSAILRIVLPLAHSDDRAGLLSAFFVQSYLAFALPAIGAGLLARDIGLAQTAYIFGAGVMVLATISLVAARRISAPT